jgi:hypothetical protein
VVPRPQRASEEHLGTLRRVVLSQSPSRIGSYEGSSTSPIRAANFPICHLRVFNALAHPPPFRSRRGWTILSTLARKVVGARVRQQNFAWLVHRNNLRRSLRQDFWRIVARERGTVTGSGQQESSSERRLLLQTLLVFIDSLLRNWSGRMDLNHRPPGPEPGALARLRYAPTDAPKSNFPT